MKLNDVTWFLGICLSGLYYLFNKMRKNEFYFFLIKSSLYFAVTFTIAFIGLVVSFNGNNHDELTSDYFNTIITTNDDNRNPDLQIQEIKENSDKFYAKDFSLFDYLGCAFAISLGVATSSMRIYRSGSCKPNAFVIFLTILSDVPIIISLLGLILSNCSRTDFTCTSSWKIARRTAFNRLDSFFAEKPATILLS